MSASKLSTRYAKSIMDLAVEQGKLESILGDVTALKHAIDENRQFELMLKSPIINQDKKQAILKQAFGDAMDPILMQFMEILVRKRREGYLGPICNSFVEQYNSLKDIRPVKIISATPMSQEVQDRITSLIREDGGGQINLEVEVDEDLIGGFILRYEDKQYDASVLRNLNLMKKEFEKNTYVKKY